MLMRRFLLCQANRSPRATTSDPAIEVTFTNDPILGSPMASDRMMPLQSPNVPIAKALRQ